jgi:uncharacterized protein YbjT (DUF2867 family)
MPLAVTTPTGHIGSALVRRLLDAGRDDVTLLLRDASKLPDDVRQRAEVREGELQDAGYVRRATEGADALFWLSPNDWTTPDLYDWYEALGRSAAGAVEANGIGHVVHLSSEGAQERSGHGPVSGLGRIEDALDATGAAVRHLRPTYFMENFEAQLGPILEAGAVFFPVPDTTTTGMIATRDIAAVAAGLLLDLGWSGTGVVTLQGPRDLSYAEAARVLSDGLGREVRAQQVPEAALKAQLQGMGATEPWADGLVELYTAIGTEGYSDTPRSEATTTPTTLETYTADTLRPMLEAMAAG